MRTVGHVIASAGVSLATYHRYRSRGAALAAFLAGWLIDIDHLFDYIKAHGWKANWLHLNEACHEKYSGKLYLPLHSYELLALFFLLFRGNSFQPFRVGISLSILLHLLLDQRFNPNRRTSTYFLTHRIRKRFDAAEILGDGYMSPVPVKLPSPIGG
jgi:hypothetical protein